MKMVLCTALSRISRRKDGGRITFERGDTFEATVDEAKRLVKLKVATVQGEIAEEEITYLSEEELNKKNKDWLQQYGRKLGIELAATMKKDDMIPLILDTIEELKSENGDS
jgi:hypothetical protein